jgi:two-component system OmpR family sensor kinase
MPVHADFDAALPGIALSPSEQFRAIAELGGDIAWSIDCASGKPLYVSPVVESVLGYSMADVAQQLGGSPGPLAGLSAGLAQRLQRLADGDATRLQLVREYDVARSDGELIALEITSRLLLDANGRAVVLVGIARDLSDRRARDKERRRFASMLNHEFRTPLSTIDGAIQRLEATHHHADEATRARYRKIGLAADRLIAMLDDYLSPERMADIGRQRKADALAPKLVLEEGAVLARAAGRHVSIELGEVPASVRCDPAGLRLAVKILVDNAIQFSPGDSTIVLRGDTVPAAPGSAVRSNLELSVSNEGAGIPADEVGLVFNKFFRGRNALGLPGSGLGLYMARSVIEVHGGTIELTSVAGQAPTVFKIHLPIRDAGKHLASAAPSSDNLAVKPG